MRFTEDDLRSFAKRASADYVMHGVPLTQAVAKVASEEGPMTREHVRRICEMTYHTTFESLYKTAPSGNDRYISFDPPDAEKAASLARATEVGKMSGSRDMLLSKEASMMSKEATAVTKFERVNAFDELVKSAQAPEVRWHNPAGELVRAKNTIDEAIRDIRAQLVSAQEEEKLAMLDLVAQAKSLRSSGYSDEQILHAGFSGTSEGYATEIASELMSFIGENAKVASGSFGEINPQHPMPRKFVKAAEARFERKHLEITLDELQRNRVELNTSLRDLL